MQGPKLEIYNVTKSFANQGQGSKEIVAVSNVSLEVREKEIVGLIGPSGSGKSTILDLVAGLTRPDEGTITLAKQRITGEPGFVSYMPQKDVLFPWRTILENVIVPLEVQGMSKKSARDTALSFLPRFGLDGFADSYPDTLSGGMRQRAAFLRTYLCKKDWMLLDEPFGKLDALTKREMQQWLLKIWQELKTSILFVTHDVDEAILLADRVYVLSARPGRIVEEVEISLPRPRSIDLEVSEGFNQLKTRLLQALKEGING